MSLVMPKLSPPAAEIPADKMNGFNYFDRRENLGLNHSNFPFENFSWFESSNITFSSVNDNWTARLCEMSSVARLTSFFIFSHLRGEYVSTSFIDETPKFFFRSFWQLMSTEIWWFLSLSSGIPNWSLALAINVLARMSYNDLNEFPVR